MTRKNLSKVYHYIVAYFMLAIVLLSLFFSSQRVFAQEYVLPYPGLMPGHPLYRISETIDRLQEWWSFGNFAKFKYHTSLSDKKLVEAKTLFEYKQYLLGYEALIKSDMHFTYTALFVEKAFREGKDTTEKQSLYRMEALKHIEILTRLEEQLPEEFVWQPEKSQPTTLRLREVLNLSIDLREKQL